MKILDSLIHSIRESADHNKNVEAKPHVILWSDEDRQWEGILPALMEKVPELYCLGEYAPENKKGPAIWLRCVIAGKIAEAAVLEGRVAILYLPGVSRQMLRAVESCEKRLKPLAELQYRGRIWSQKNNRDWTILAYLVSNQDGLGLDVAKDEETKKTLLLSLPKLIHEDVTELKNKQIQKTFLTTLIAGEDPIREMLDWLNDASEFKKKKNAAEWTVFLEVAKTKFSVDPEKDGDLLGAQRLLEQKGIWKNVWERFCETPTLFPKLPILIKKLQMPNFGLFPNVDVARHWPYWNIEQEEKLRMDLLATRDLPWHLVLSKIEELEKTHSHRRKTVWTKLGESRLAEAMEYLYALSTNAKNKLNAGNLEDLANAYQTSGWKVDQALLNCLNLIDSPKTEEAIHIAIRSIYLPWAEESALYLQKQVKANQYKSTLTSVNQEAFTEGEVVLFVDGLRFDTAKMLTESLSKKGLSVLEKQNWVALPSVTATGKAAVSPVIEKITGDVGNIEFEPSVKKTGQSLKGGYHFKRLIEEKGWRVLSKNEMGDGRGNAWCEFGEIDQEGHSRGWKLAHHIDTILNEITDKVNLLLAAGWRKVRIVTDHGWLLVPGGLPKTDLSNVLVDTRWARCAAVKPDSHTDEELYPWYWNANQLFALASGISCYKKNEEYAHGGLSLQECLTLELSVTSSGKVELPTGKSFLRVVWKAMRCEVKMEIAFAGMLLDIRKEALNPDSSVVNKTKLVSEDGESFLIVNDDSLETQKVYIVALKANQVIAQIETTVGGESHD